MKTNRLIELSDLATEYNLQETLLVDCLRELNSRPIYLNQRAHVSTLESGILESLAKELKKGESFQKSIETIKKTAFLYRCQLCRDLKISGELLLEESQLLHICRLPQAKVSPGHFELIEIGPLDKLYLWADSLLKKLDDPFRGV